MVNKDFEIVFH